MIKCSICSYQCDNWYVFNRRLACHINFFRGAWFNSLLLASSRVTLAWHKAKRGTPFGVTKRLIPVSRKKNERQGVNWNENDWNVRACICFAISNRLLQRLLLAIARTQSPLPEILLWTTPSEPPRALQASECSELLDPTRASCLIPAQRQPGKFTFSEMHKS